MSVLKHPASGTSYLVDRITYSDGRPWRLLVRVWDHGQSSPATYTVDDQEIERHGSDEAVTRRHIPLLEALHTAAQKSHAFRVVAPGSVEG